MAIAAQEGVHSSISSAQNTASQMESKGNVRCEKRNTDKKQHIMILRRVNECFQCRLFRKGYKTPKNSTRDKRGYKNKGITASTEVLDLQ